MENFKIWNKNSFHESSGWYFQNLLRSPHFLLDTDVMDLPWDDSISCDYYDDAFQFLMSTAFQLHCMIFTPTMALLIILILQELE